MIFEFTGTDEQLKNYCLIPFFAGLVVLFYYYVIYLPFQRKRKTNVQIEVILPQAGSAENR
jgi:hypothetical protein